MSRKVGTAPTLKREVLDLTPEEFAAVSSDIEPIIPRYDLYTSKSDWLNQKWTELIVGLRRSPSALRAAFDDGGERQAASRRSLAAAARERRCEQPARRMQHARCRRWRNQREPMSGLAINDITKQFGNFTAVDNVNLTVPHGTFVCLLGPSGCGKTTLLRMIAGLEEPTSGAILLDGEDITPVPTHKRNLGMVFQSLALFPHLIGRRQHRLSAAHPRRVARKSRRSASTNC